MTNLEKLQELRKLTNDKVLLEYLDTLITIELEIKFDDRFTLFLSK
jgi:hypothetical protein